MRFKIIRGHTVLYQWRATSTNKRRRGWGEPKKKEGAESGVTCVLFFPFFSFLLSDSSSFSFSHLFKVVECVDKGDRDVVVQLGHEIGDDHAAEAKGGELHDVAQVGALQPEENVQWRALCKLAIEGGQLLRLQGL